MFTGLVEDVGHVAEIAHGQAGARIAVRSALVAEGLAIGDSVAVNGACLTAVALAGDGFAFDAVAETLRRTALGALAEGDPVNLERALRAGARLGGHIVQGHVDALGIVRGAVPEGESVLLDIGAPPEALRYVVEKGSIAVDGVSLTVAVRLPDGFRVAIVPHTTAATTLGPGTVGRTVNVELDVLAKYVEALIAPYERARGGP